MTAKEKGKKAHRKICWGQDEGNTIIGLLNDVHLA